MSVEIDPQELGFHRPFTMEVTQILKLKNPNPTPVAFKVKTTAPKQYCVRPNSGRIEPGKEVEVTVILQPFKQEPGPDVKCRDKFLVQSVALTADYDFSNNNSIWQHVDEAEKSTVQEKKIRVVYLPAEGTLAATPLRNSRTPDAPPAYSSNRSPSPEAFTPDNRAAYAAAPSPHPNTAEESTVSKTIKEAQNTINVAASKVANAAPMSYGELEAKLAEAEAKIAGYARESGLKLRQVAKGETGNKTVDDIAHRTAQASQGVPLQIAAGLCLVSFLLAYLFF